MPEAQKYEVAIREAESRFVAIAEKTHAPVIFAIEAEFARQALANNAELAKTALANPASLRDSIVNLAALGLSLNPLAREAYLVARGGKVTVADDYRGIVKLHVEAGAILSAKPALVHANDVFDYEETDTGPRLSHKPALRDAGEVIGGYCRIQLPNGSYELRYVSAEDIQRRRDFSPAKNGPWKTWTAEMQLKTVVRIASKEWPKRTNPRLLALYEIQAREEPPEEEPHRESEAGAIDVTEGNEETSALDESHLAATEYISTAEFAALADRMGQLGVSDDAMCKALEVDNIEAITTDQLGKAREMLDQHEKFLAHKAAQRTAGAKR